MRNKKGVVGGLLLMVVPAGTALAEPLRAGVSTVDLTPPLEWGFALGGYGERMSKPAEAIHDSVLAKGLVLAQGEKRYAIVTIDILGLPPNIKPQVLAALSGQGWSADNVMLLPSHSHASLEMAQLNDKNTLGIPQIGIFDKRLMEHTVGVLAKAIAQAGGALAPVKVGTGSKLVHGMNRNRRGDETTDRELTITRIDKMDGQPLAALVHWTAHPTFMSEKDMWASAGWPGALQRGLEAWIGHGVTAMYYNGAEGDQAPAGAQGASRYAKAEDYGRKMTIEALELYQRIKPVENPIFAYGRQVIELPSREAHPNFKATGGAEYGLDDARMKILLEKLCPAETASGAVRIGDLLIAGVPGEMICELGLRIKGQLRKSGAAHPVIGGLADEWISYILTADEYGQSGYESSVSFYGPTLGETIVAGVLKAATPLAEKR
jgi:hypothetical protein